MNYIIFERYTQATQGFAYLENRTLTYKPHYVHGKSITNLLKIGESEIPQMETTSVSVVMAKVTKGGKWQTIKIKWLNFSNLRTWAIHVLDLVGILINQFIILFVLVNDYPHFDRTLVINSTSNCSPFSWRFSSIGV